MSSCFPHKVQVVENLVSRGRGFRRNFGATPVFPLRVRLCFALRLAEPKFSKAERRLVEVARVELASEMASIEHLRVYWAFGLGRGMPAHGLIPSHPLDSAPCSGQVEPPAAWPAKLCLGAQQTSALRHRGRLVRRRERNRCSQLLFSLVFYVANEDPRRATRPQHIPSKPDHPPKNIRPSQALPSLCPSFALGPPSVATADKPVRRMVEIRGVEPLTFSMPLRRSTN